MAKTKVGTVVTFRRSSPILAIFRLMPENGSPFPPYKAGQYIALRRDDCRLTKKVIENGHVDYLPVLDGTGNLKKGPVTHSYSVASAPFETTQSGDLEFYVILETDEKGLPGRLTESMFRMSPDGDNRLVYFDRITGDFTLDKRAVGARQVVMVGTGTGVAPFVSMIKQLQFEAAQGKKPEARYMLVHANRTHEELDYHEELSAIADAGRLDFLYVPSVSRPTAGDLANSKVGKGRANNLLRHVLGMPLKEEEELQAAIDREEDLSRTKAALERTVKPVLPQFAPRESLRERFNSSDTVVMTCGNPFLMADIEDIAKANQIRFEKEDW